MLPLPCMLVCTFVCANRTRDRGCSKHPVFPAPSNFEEGKRRCKPRAQCAARSRRYVNRHCERSEAIHAAACRRMDCFVADAPRNDAEGAGYDGIHLTSANRASASRKRTIRRSSWFLPPGAMCEAYRTGHYLDKDGATREAIEIMMA